MPNQREIFTAPFPFSDEDSEKKRPVLIISNSVFNAISPDVLVMALTSNLAGGQSGVVIDPSEIEHGALPVRSVILPHKLYTVAQTRLEKYVGRITPDHFNRAMQLLQEILC
jgi:mRNA interferase MazF